MRKIDKTLFQHFLAFLTLILVLTLQISPVAAGEYDSALKDVKGVKVMFNVSGGDPTFANVVFWAVRDVYNNDAIASLPEKPEVVIVFHGPVVKLLTSDRTGFSPKENEAIDTFQASLRQMKKEGVRMEVCLYAAKVLGVDPATIMPEIDQVGNGFISVAGYQAQGYSVITIP